MLQRDFVLGWKNIAKEEYVGSSHGYSKRQTSVGTTNGAGPGNLQIFVLSPDLVVMHALPGFWHPEDLARELRFSKVLLRLWRDESRSREQKERMFERLQLAEINNHPKATFARSTWQGFDAQFERSRMKTGARDTVLITDAGKIKKDRFGMPAMKPLNVLVHERMARRPFIAFSDFDIASFVDYGRKFYDNNQGIDKRRKTFRPPPKKRKKRRAR